MALITTLDVGLKASQTSPKDLTTATANVNYAKRLILATGTATNQADLIFSDNRTITASGTDALDLAGSLVDALGVTLSFARVKGLIVVAAAANVNDVVIGGAASNTFINWVGDATDKIKVKPGGVFCLFAPGATGYPVTAATGDQLLIANSSSGTSVTYDVVIIGASA